MELFVVVAAVVAVAVGVVDGIAAEVAAALEIVEVHAVGWAAVVAVVVLAADEGCCYSSSTVRHCWLAAGLLIE